MKKLLIYKLMEQKIRRTRFSPCDTIKVWGKSVILASDKYSKFFGNSSHIEVRVLASELIWILDRHVVNLSSE